MWKKLLITCITNYQIPLTTWLKALLTRPAASLSSPTGSAWSLASPPQLGFQPHRTPSTVRPMVHTLLLQHYHLTPPSSTTSPYAGISCLSYLFLVRSQNLHIISPPTILPYFGNGLYLGVSEIQNNNISLDKIT